MLMDLVTWYTSETHPQSNYTKEKYQLVFSSMNPKERYQMEEYETRSDLVARIVDLNREFGNVKVSNNQRGIFEIDEGTVTYSGGLDPFEFKELCFEVLGLLKG